MIAWLPLLSLSWAMTTAQFLYATVATFGLSIGRWACFGWFRWWLALVFAGAALWASMLPATAQEVITDSVTHVRDGDTVVIGRYTAVRLQGVMLATLVTTHSAADFCTNMSSWN